MGFGAACREVRHLKAEGSAGLRVAGFPVDFRCRRKGVSERLLQFYEAFALIRLNRHDGDTQFFGKLDRVQSKTGLLGEVHHVERNYDGDFQLDDFERDLEVALKIRGVENADDEIRFRNLCVVAAKNIASNLLVGRTAFETVAAGKINQIEGLTVSTAHAALLHRNRDTGIVADLFNGARQCVEKRRFPCIRISREGDQIVRCLHEMESGIGRLNFDLISKIAAQGNAGAADRTDEVATVRELPHLD